MLSLTGTWNGRFDYEGARLEARSFVVELVQPSEWLSGRIEETASRGPFAGRPITATLNGRLTGLRVSFLKIYDIQDGWHDVVSYAGEVTPDGLEISGRWKVGRSSGPFLMVRPDVPQLAVARSEQERV